MKINLTLLFLMLAVSGLQAQPAPGAPGGTNRMTFQERLRQNRLRPLPVPGGAAGAAAVPAAAGTPAGTPAGGAGVPAAPVAAGSAPAPAPAPAAPEEMVPAGMIDFEGVDVNQVLKVYADLVNRTVLRSQLPEVKIVLKTQTALTKSETIQALQAVLALNGVSIINIGDKFVKAVQSEQANTAGAEFNQLPSAQLPNLGSYVTHIVQMKYIKPTEILPIIQPFGKLQNSAVAFDSTGILVLRDYAENVKRMLELIEQIDVNIPAEYTSEVIPIRYAQAADIAAALNSLGGAGGSTVSFGSSQMGTSQSGLRGGGGGFGGGSSMGGSSYGGSGGYNGISSGGSSFGGQNRVGSFGGGGSSFGSGSSVNPNGTPSSGSTFASRLASIVQSSTAASGPGGSGNGKQEPIQVFGQAKIIADQRSNALLVFATKQDMVNIKHVIGELDVLLAQVLIEAVILDVHLGKSFQFSLSAAQNQKSFTGGGTPIVGGGGFNNGPPFINFLSSATNSVSSLGTNAFSGIGSGTGLNYFGDIGPTWDIAMQALQSDTTANVIQRPRIQTSQAKSASFFVGETVPYVTGTYYGGGYSGGNSSQYSQLSVGVELDVTPFINPDGLVVMDIAQEIDDISGNVQIDNNPVPITTKRTLNSEIAVRDHDTIILGGFVRDDKSKSKSGVPLLMDIPLLGNLFTSRSDSKTREELLVLMRPTVLKTPEAASSQTLTEERRLPGVSAAQSDQAVYERSLIDAQRKQEKRDAKNGRMDGYYNATTTMDPTNAVVPEATSTNSAAVPVK